MKHKDVTKFLYFPNIYGIIQTFAALHYIVDTICKMFFR